MNNDEILKKLLEPIVLNEDNLLQVKDAVNKADDGEITKRQLKEKLLELRINVLEELIEYFPFIVKQLSKTNTITEFSKDDSDKAQLLQELEEKNILLETIGSRFNNILEKLGS